MITPDSIHIAIDTLGAMGEAKESLFSVHDIFGWLSWVFFILFLFTDIGKNMIRKIRGVVDRTSDSGPI